MYNRSKRAIWTGQVCPPGLEKRDDREGAYVLSMPIIAEWG